MNKSQAIFNSLSDAQLKAIVTDLKHLSETGILPAGPARELTQEIHTEIGVPVNHAMSMVQTESLKIAAFKWAVTK